MAVVKWSPWPELEAMERRMRRMFEDTSLAAAGTPNADVYETDTEWVVEVEAPGYAEKDLTVEVSDRVLCIKGERSEEQEKREKSYQLRERLEASFERRFTLPTEADAEHVAATFTKGVLEVHAPKLKLEKAKTVPIAAK